MSNPLQPLAELLQLQRRMRALDRRESLAFFMVNETHRLTNYHQAALWEGEAGKLAAASGVASLDSHAPFCRGFSALCRQWQQTFHKITAIRAQSLSAEDSQFWQEYLPENGLWIPLPHLDKERPMSLILFKDTPWSEPEKVLLEQLADAYGHAWQSLARQKKNHRSVPRIKRKGLVVGMALALIMLIPVRQSVLAPAEVVANKPTLLRAPLSGVVDVLEVKPNQAVLRGDVLVSLDARELLNQRENARQQLASAEAQYRQAQQMALSDADAKAQLAVLASRRQQTLSEMTFIESQLDRMALKSPRDGIVIFDNANDLLGRSVSVGERIMMVADPSDTRLEIQLPAGDAIALENGAEVRLFLNVAPNSPQDAVLTQIGYRATPDAENVMAYRLLAEFNQPESVVRVGLKGTAKIYGERTVLIAYLMRKPWSSLRVWLGV
ncbi:HlyD family efflux transporter periplasmic adaptor subunit [uncultured Cedecea sp.]|uniref:efflux RND transporter periplasmic adaptor subunit n=1 Tax=uncultured Cedecea sp. TaxID=988762 RepID=UPI002602968C|nr:HlyD family efflux transporter periplasmic adaptor subunit [uncultured Cedecea sp.]